MEKYKPEEAMGIFRRVARLYPENEYAKRELKK